MRRVHPLIQATVIGASVAFSMSAFAGGEYGSKSDRSSSTYEGRTGSSAGATENSAERAQRRDSQTGTGQTTGPAAGATGATGSSRDTTGPAADSAINAQRRDSATGTGQTTGPAGAPAPGERSGSGSYGADR